MQKIIAIGGGSIGFGAAKAEVTLISREIIRLSGKSHPRLLFIPTASSDDKAYVRAVQAHFGRKLGCQVEVLYLLGGNLNLPPSRKDAKNVIGQRTEKRQTPSFKDIQEKINWADIIYVGGGNTLMMMNRWKRLGVDRLIRRVRETGKVLCGSSAGALCWFRQGNSDSRKYYDPKADLIKVTGLGFLPALGCPHYNVEKDRKPQLKAMMRKTSGTAIAMDNCAALEVVGDRCRALTAKPNAGTYKVYWKAGRYHEVRLRPQEGWVPLTGFLTKG